MTIDVRGAAQSIQGAEVLRGIDACFRKGRFYGIIGPNGVGKSTLLGLLAGTDKPTRGEVLLDNMPLTDFPRKDLASRLAVLQQGGLPSVGFTVREVVGMGRYPYQNWLGGEKNDPGPIVDEALETMGLTSLQHRKLGQLSGGERQRVALAKLMVQQPGIILLDEPTTYLDIGYQIGLLDTVKAWQREQDLLVIAVLHDLNLAALYCDELIALHRGVVAASGTPEKVLHPELIRQIYETEATVVAHPDTGAPQVMLRPGV